ncbi:GH25 family lysozyme [Lactobacillaceae bacterium Melli_B4]
MNKKWIDTRINRLSKRKRIDRLKLVLKLFISCSLLLILWKGFFWYQDYQYQKLMRYPIRGVTVSQQHSYVDFISLANVGEKFVYIRASQGAIYTDDDFNDNYQRSLGASLKVGVYHSFSFNSSAKQQFENFSSEVGNNIGILPIAIQINNNDVVLNEDQIKSVQRFIKMVQSRYDRRVVIWSAKRIFDQVNIGRNRCLFWSLSNSIEDSKYALKTYNANQTIKNDGQNQQFIQAVFVGSSHQWQQYIQPNLNQNGGKISEH